ncbi:sulfotransferase domain protein [Thioploca ingrica]|uniref:Sulfotransferase domain protein n=1 Tax=Thioploca ingrica TaxID=40754 RepID=A0A090AFT4_9GAMM|nr:sulfotransferase domain protein [Thioploca ingrica]
MKIKGFFNRANKWVNNLAIPWFQCKLPVWCFSEHNLRFKAYCVGAAKTGTVSIHATFSQQYRSAHEPEREFLIHHILAFIHGKIDKSELTQYIRHRDRRLALEMDSSHLNYHLLDILVSEFSDAKFILTIRDCYSWLDSFLNFHYPFYSYLRDNPQLRRRNRWIKLYDIDFKANEFKHAREENIFANNGLYALDSYFSYWREHNSKVLTTVPEERLLVVKTQEINQSVKKIEEFLGIPLGTLPQNVHRNVKRRKFNLLSQINKDFLEEKANFHCNELMGKYFPEVKGFNF